MTAPISIGELEATAADLRKDADDGMSPQVEALARQCGKDDAWIGDQVRKTCDLAEALAALIAIAKAALDLERVYDFSEDARRFHYPEMQRLIAALKAIAP